MRGGTLHGQMQAQIGIAVAGVGQQPGVGHDDRIRAQPVRGVYRVAPFLRAARLHERVDGEQHLTPLAMRQFDACADVVFGEVEPGEIAGVGRILEPEIDGVGARLDGGFQGGEAAGRGHELDGRDQTGVRPKA
ncbi:hypothetical protein G6F65_018977 [Rhizopus arrhizus]|nr:hypothetical protein G6F68_016691 [Rhizopus microsporus]KAG1249817.1 hypothetical protein G6F65_018977 [Rhizopus arrhizus]